MRGEQNYENYEDVNRDGQVFVDSFEVMRRDVPVRSFIIEHSNVRHYYLGL